MNIELMYDGKQYGTDIPGYGNVSIETDLFSIHIVCRDKEDVSTIERLLGAAFGGVIRIGHHDVKPLSEIVKYSTSFAGVKVKVRNGELYINKRNVKEFM